MKEPWNQLHDQLTLEEPQLTRQLLDQVSDGEVALTVDRLDHEDQNRLLESLPSEQAADLLEDLSHAQAAELLDHLEPLKAAALVEDLVSATQADLLGELNEKKSEAILREMPTSSAQLVRELLCHDEESAGGLMKTELLSYLKSATVGDVLDDLRANAETYSDFDVLYAYVVTKDHQLVGVLRMRDLLLQQRHVPISSLMIPDPDRVLVDAPLLELQTIFDEHDFVGLPVVDLNDRLIGVVLRRAVYEASTQAVADDLLKLSGVGGGEELRSMSLRSRSGRRLSWLSINILLNVAAASVIAFFQDTLSQVIALAVFLPIISDMSGCSGSQAVAVSIRELTLGLVRPTELLRVLGKEAAVGVINGLVLGSLLAGVALVWKGNPWLGLVVGGALMLNTLVAVCLGGSIPLVLKRFDLDPALASGPILTTVTDMCGFLLVLGFATAALPRIL